MDKTKNLAVSLELIDDKVRFAGTVEGQSPVYIDYLPPVGTSDGYTSLELLLLSLTSCMSTAILLFLRRMGRQVDALRVTTEADRQQEHPTILTQIHLRFFLVSPDVQMTDFEKVLAMSEERFCPVYSMLNPRVKVIATGHIERPEGR
jgi:putative redox protein